MKLSLRGACLLVPIVVLGLAPSLGCSVDALTETSSSEDALIGGKDDTKTSAAVGALVDIMTIGGKPGYVPFCTATLIAPKVVLTAKHCTLSKRRYGFAIGLHAATDLVTERGPARVVPVERAEEESTVGGAAASGMGSDVSVVYLKDPIVDVAPLPLGDLVDADIGKTFTAIGYGDRGKENGGVRTSGRVVLKARRGKALANVLSFEDYDRLWGGDANENRSYYDGLALLDEYEVMTSRAPGVRGVQPCAGDSGGPLLGLRGGKPTVFGVASLVLSTQTEACAIGTVYATLGPAARALIARALATSSQ